MTNWTIAIDAEGFVETINKAPDHETFLNLVDELKSRYTSIAASLELLANSNERWALEAKQKRAAVEAHIEAMTGMFDDDCLPSAVNDLAEAFDISMKRDFTGYITITYKVSGTAERKFDEENIGTNLDIIKDPKFDGMVDGIDITDSDFFEVLSTTIEFN